MVALDSDPARGQGRIYVDENAAGVVHDGSSWCKAYLTLSEAVAAAAASGRLVSEIRVADGT
ncbi:MAG: hypothetical protein J5J06_13130 [Phycisphaerae bacterium]|nr:hypothetical protein [Phycisphaerae bacterium]